MGIKVISCGNKSDNIWDIKVIMYGNESDRLREYTLTLFLV